MTTPPKNPLREAREKIADEMVCANECPQYHNTHYVLERCTCYKAEILALLSAVQQEQACPKCRGNGFDPIDKGGATELREPFKCPACDGTGSRIRQLEKQVEELKGENTRLKLSFEIVDDRVLDLEACFEEIKKRNNVGSEIEILCVAALDNVGASPSKSDRKNEESKKV